jgi:hypothetical protein
MENAEVAHAQDLSEGKKETSEKELNKNTKSKFSDPDKLSRQHNIKLNSIIEEVRHLFELETD